MQLLKKIRLYVEVIILRCLKWGWMPLWMLNVNNRTSFPTISYNVPPNPILHLDSDQPLRMCSCKRISVFAISFMRMTFTSANFFNYDQTMAIACTYITQGGGGGTLIFSAYVGSDPASALHPPKKYQEFQAPQKNI